MRAGHYLIFCNSAITTAETREVPMKIQALLLSVALITWPTQLVVAQDVDGYQASIPFYFSDYDPESGRQAFIDLKCVACHQVRGDSDLPVPITKQQGPVLAAWAIRSPGDLMDSIIAPSHRIAPGSDGRDTQGGLSRMANFNDSMTVRQLIDILAYLNSFED
jgi:mono/diheme cytochrome c family protein